MKKDKDCYVINPNWGLIAVLTITITVVMYCLENSIKSNFPRYNFSFLHILILGAALFVFGRQYVFHREGISVSVLGIPIQRIYWYDVREVYIVQQKKLGQSDDRIYVFRTSSPCAGTDVEKMAQFSLYHPFDVLNIMIPDRKTDLCTNAIRQYCGDSDSVVVIRKTRECMNNEPNVKSARPHVFRMPLMILLGLVVALLLLVRVGLPMWAAREERISAIPQSGTFVCDDLAVSISFGKGTLLILPDGTTMEVAIDYGQRMTGLSEDAPEITGWYEAHLEDGYIEIRFTELSVPFDPDCSYRFTME